MPDPIVFVVDDDSSVRRSLKRLIRSQGLEVETFASADDFLRRDLWLPETSSAQETRAFHGRAA